ncbi:MAG: excinuclease ABC subunit UvrA [Nitrospiraceae bacterium]|nr:excinuclease ABC subunit UvrA [Nitrospiraceae bacterium]
MSQKDLIIEGARQNNLKNISLSLPHNKVIAITGVSGSGKSSLAFDTIYAEGQWRFIESLSTYARLFLEKLDRPDVDAIRNIRPAIALEQKNPVRGSRSTVGTLTELYELFRLLYAKIAAPHCPQCGKEIRMWDPHQVVAELIEKYSGKKALIIFSAQGSLDELGGRGFRRLWLDGEIHDIDDVGIEESGGGSRGGVPPSLRQSEVGAPFPSHDVVLDRVVLRDEPRLADSVEMAWKEGNGQMKVVVMDGGAPSVRQFSSGNSCEECEIELPPATALLFSFNHPVGACPVCKGFGNTLLYDEDLIIPDRSRSLADGAVDPWNKPAYRWWKKQLLAKGKKAGLDVRKPYGEFTPEEKELLFKGGEGFYGIDDFFEDMEGRRYKLHVRVFLSRYRRGFTCPECQGKRLTKAALSYRISGLDIAEICRMPVTEGMKFFESIELSPFRRDIAKELLRQVSLKLQFLEKVGLGYLALDRYGKTLSGGEYQRINLSNQLSSLLTGTLYVLDEPTVGLHARDTERISGIMNRLADLGNTVIVVEHDRGVIEAAGWIVELGPGGGHKGGEVVFCGPSQEFSGADTLTARYMRGDEKVGVSLTKRRAAGKFVSVSGARGNNLKGVDLRVPLNTLTVVSGVSGSGKSSLVVETLYRALSKKFGSGGEPPLPLDRLEGDGGLKGVRLIDQSPIGRSPRSNPVTYLKIFDQIRRLFSEQREARAYGYGPGFFSFNVTGGRCETCKGEGYELMEMYFFEDLYVRCEKCDGRRYGPEALRIRYRDKDISDILNMTVEEARGFFSDQPKIRGPLGLMADTGLGYLRLGQPATTLSGGEAQRLKICAEMGNLPSPRVPGEEGADGYLYILDEPTVGLHFADVQALLDVLGRLVDGGNTVLVIEHNLDVIRAADHIIDLGPEGGDKGGKIVFEGTPAGIVKSRKSYTGRYLRNHR